MGLNVRSGDGSKCQVRGWVYRSGQGMGLEVRSRGGSKCQVRGWV